LARSTSRGWGIWRVCCARRARCSPA
jgi:hypothetical protein